MTMRTSQRASDLKLLAVGIRESPKKSCFAQKNDSYRSQRDEPMEDESVPLRKVKLEEDQVSVSKFSGIQDPRLSRFSHAKILLMQKNLLLLTFLIIFLGMIHTELQQSSQAANLMLLVIDLGNLFLMILILLRKMAIFQLEIDQRRIYLPRHQRTVSPNYLRIMLKNRDYLVQLVLEMMFALPHPSILLVGQYYFVYSDTHQKTLKFSVNDLFGLLSLIKVGLILRSIIGLSIYSNPRAVRMCHYSGIDHDFFFVVKCLQQQHPLRYGAVICGLSLLIFGQGFRITQGQLSFHNDLPKNGFQSLSNCYWTVFSTMTTIGYGQYIPTTSLAQLLAVSLAILGVVNSCQQVVALSGYLRMKVSEARSHTVLYRLCERDGLRKQSVSVLVETVRLAQMMRKDSVDPLITKILKPRFQVLKGSIDAAKAHHKRIKSIVPTETITQEMIRSFELLKDNFKDIYVVQRKIKGKIEQMESHKDFKHGQMRRSFIEEVNNIMHKVRR